MVIAAPRMRHFHLRAGSVSSVQSASTRADEPVEHRAVAATVVGLEREDPQPRHGASAPAPGRLPAAFGGAVGQALGGR